MLAKRTDKGVYCRDGLAGNFVTECLFKVEYVLNQYGIKLFGIGIDRSIILPEKSTYGKKTCVV